MGRFDVRAPAGELRPRPSRTAPRCFIYKGEAGGVGVSSFGLENVAGKRGDPRVRWNIGAGMDC
jgi:hypothetical protein